MLTVQIIVNTDRKSLMACHSGTNKAPRLRRAKGNGGADRDRTIC